MMDFFRNFYYYCVIQYFLYWPVRLFVCFLPFLVLFLSFLVVGVGTILADENLNDEDLKIAFVDRLPHNDWKDDRAAAQPIREELRNNEFLNRDFSFTNLKDKGEIVEVNYTEELRPYMYKKRMVDVRDYEYFRQLDNPPPRKPFKQWAKEHITFKNVAIATVLFVASMIFLGWLDEKLEGAIMDDLLELQRQIDEDIAEGWAIELERWERFKRWIGYTPSNDGPTSGSSNS